MANKAKLKNMIRDLEQIEKECLPDSMRQNDKGDGNETANLDAFSAAKRDLTNFLKELEEGIKQRESILAEFGRCQQAIELKSTNDKLLESAKNKHKELSAIFDKEAGKKKPKYTPEDLESMKNLVNLYAEEIGDLERAHNNRGKEKKQDFARNLRDQRMADREAASAQAKAEGRTEEPKAAQPITGQTQAFLERKAEHDLEFAKAEDEILSGVKRLHGIAQGMQTELEAQELIINDIDKQMDKLDAKFKVSNKALKKLVADSGGTSRWCVLLFLFLVLLALIGYMFNIFTF